MTDTLRDVLAEPHQSWCSCLLGPCDCGHDVAARNVVLADGALREALGRDQANTDIDLRNLLRHTYALAASQPVTEDEKG